MASDAALSPGWSARSPPGLLRCPRVRPATPRVHQRAAFLGGSAGSHCCPPFRVQQTGSQRPGGSHGGHGHPAGRGSPSLLAAQAAATGTGPLAQPHAWLPPSAPSLAAPSHHQGSAALGCRDTGCQGLSGRPASVWTTEGPSPPRRTQTHPTPAGAAVTDPPRLPGSEQGGKREALCAAPPSPGSAPRGRCWGGTSGAHRWEARIPGASRRLSSSGPARKLP